MRVLFFPGFLVVLLLSLPVATPARADQADPRLERLFNQLAAARSAPEADTVTAQINAIWLHSGSDTVDLLMSRASIASEAQDFDAAMKLFDAVAEMRPAYAEVWYRRAELLLAMDSQQEAAVDLAKAIALETRHFRAHALLGLLADQSGNRAAALAAYRRALTLNPMLDAVAKRAQQLGLELGRPPV